MKKAIVGVAGVGAIIAFRQLAQRIRHKMYEHCSEMGTQGQRMADSSAYEARPSAARDPIFARHSPAARCD